MEKKLTTVSKIIYTIQDIAKIQDINIEEIQFSFSEIYEANPEVPKASIRARVYENMGKLFKRLGRDLYAVIKGAVECIVIQGDGRKVDFIPDGFAQLILNDHPWENPKANKGGNRDFAPYKCFTYTIDDFKEKYRILQDGGFLVEFMPEESETNFEYLYKVKKMALEAGFKYYAKVPWVKGTLKLNTGRKSTNVEDVMIFSKGKARALRFDKQRTNKIGETQYMSGANGMLPTEFNVQPPNKKNKKHPAEKPVELMRTIISYLTKAYEVVIDQFAGSGVTGEACMTLEEPRQCVLIEYSKEYVSDIVERLNCISLTSDTLTAI